MNDNVQVYVGTTLYNQDQLFDYFEFNVEKGEDLISQQMIDMNMDYYDEDYLTIHYEPKSSLKYFLDYMDSFVNINIDEQLVDKFHNIDFIVIIDIDKAFAKVPQNKFFKNKYIDVTFLGEFSAQYIN